MASIILTAAGSAIGGAVGGSLLGVSAATIGCAIGSLAGAAIDSWLVAAMAPTQRIAGQRLDTLQITSSTEGAVIPRVYGRMRVGGNIVWATDFREETRTAEQGGGKGGGGGGTEVTEYFYFASFAVALSEGPITGIGRIWADGKPMSREGVTMRVHLGTESQDPDPFIAAKTGAANTPAYRGTAYVVFEELALERYGNRLQQLTFEVFRPILDGESAESLPRHQRIRCRRPSRDRPPGTAHLSRRRPFAGGLPAIFVRQVTSRGLAGRRHSAWRPERFRRPTDGARSLRTIVSGAERSRADGISVLEHTPKPSGSDAWRSISLLVSRG